MHSLFRCGAGAASLALAQEPLMLLSVVAPDVDPPESQEVMVVGAHERSLA